MKRNIGTGLALTLVVGLVAGLAQGYPLDGFPWTGIVRLEAFRLASTGTGRPSFLTEGEMQPSDWIRLGLVDQSGFSIPAADPALSRIFAHLRASRPPLGSHFSAFVSIDLTRDHRVKS